MNWFLVFTGGRYVDYFCLPPALDGNQQRLDASGKLGHAAIFGARQLFRLFNVIFEETMAVTKGGHYTDPWRLSITLDDH